jgi:hypothetical protein
MARFWKNKVKESNTFAGVLNVASVITLTATVATGFRSFAASGIANGNSVYVDIEDALGNWMVFDSTYATLGTALTVVSILDSSNGGGAVTFPAGTKTIFLTIPDKLFPTGDATASQLVLGADSRFEKKPINYADLVQNGLGQLKNNINWSTWGIDLVNAPPGASASFTSNTLNVALFTDEFIHVDPYKAYRGVVYAKATTLGSGCGFFAGVACYDVDGVQIQAYNHTSYPGSAQAVLTRAVNPGDTAIYISDGSGWAANSALAYQRIIRLGNFKSTAGYVYPVSDGMYSQLFLCGGIAAGNFGGANPLWNQSVSSITDIGGGEWRIDLAAALPAFSAALTANFGASIPIGTPVENGNSGGTYKYTFASNVPISGTWATAWQRFEATIGGFDVSRNNLTNRFAPGTAKIKPIFLPNQAGTAAGVTAVGLSFDVVRVNPSRLVNDANPVPKTSSHWVNVYGALTDGYSDVRLLAWLDDVRLNKDVQFTFNFNTAANDAGTTTNANILAAMRQLKAYGAEISGYVDTGYGSKTLDQVIMGALQWRNLYGDLIDFIFCDQAGGADTAVNRQLYKSIRQRLEELSFAVCFNSGSPLLASWYEFSGGDDVFGKNAIICISEGNTAPSELDMAGYTSSHYFVDKKRLMIILKNQTLAYLTSVLPTIRKHYGWFSFADDNVYSSRPIWLRDVIGQLKTNTKSVSVTITKPSQVVKIPVPLEAGGYSNLQFTRLAFDTSDFQADEFELEPVTVNPYRDAVTGSQGFMIVPATPQAFLVGTFIIYYQS